MNVYKVPSAVFEMNIFNIAEESRFAHQYSHFLFGVNKLQLSAAYERQNFEALKVGRFTVRGYTCDRKN